MIYLCFDNFDKTFYYNERDHSSSVLYLVECRNIVCMDLCGVLTTTLFNETNNTRQLISLAPKHSFEKHFFLSTRKHLLQIERHLAQIARRRQHRCHRLLDAGRRCRHSCVARRSVNNSFDVVVVVVVVVVLVLLGFLRTRRFRRLARR